jgi:hypothetical protein
VNYVSVRVISSFRATEYISWANGGVLGNGENAALPSDPFLLTGPSGDNYDLIGTDSELKQAVDDFYSQPRTTNLYVQNLPSEGTLIQGEPMIPISGTDRKQWQVRSTKLESLVEINKMTSSGLVDITGDEASYDLTLGTVTYDTEMNDDLYIDYRIDALTYGLKKLASKDVQVVFKANETNIDNLQKVVDHAELASATQRFRMGIGMMPSGQVLDKTWLGYIPSLKSHRFAYIAHKCDETDAAAAAAGKICGNVPSDSLTLETVYCDQDPSDPFTDDEEQTFWDNQVIAFQPNRWEGSGVTFLHTYNMSPESNNMWIDHVRTSDYCAILVISRLTNPRIIGGIGFTRPGMVQLRSTIEASLMPALNYGFINRIKNIDIPIEPIIIKGDSASPAEKQYLLDEKSNRLIRGIQLVYEYPASPDKIDVTMVIE